MQIDLLADVPPRTPMQTARVRGEEAGEACLKRAENKAGFDSAGARQFVHSQLVRFGEMSGEALVNAAKEHGFRPMEDRAFGPIFSKLSRDGLIRCVGYCLREKGNSCAGGRLWRAVL